MSVTACHCCEHNAKCIPCFADGGKGAGPHCLQCEHGNGNADAPGPKCWTCKRANQDDIRIEKTPHVGDRCLHVLAAKPTKDPAFTFAGHAEEARLLLHELAALSPVEFVAALHMARGGHSRDLVAVIGEMVSGCRKLKTANGNKRYGRALMSMRKQALTTRMPELASIFWGRSS